MSDIIKNRLVLLFNASLEAIRAHHVEQPVAQPSSISARVGVLVSSFFSKKTKIAKPVTTVSIFTSAIFQPIDYTKTQAIAASSSSTITAATSDFDLVLARVTELKNTTLPDMGELTGLIEQLRQINPNSADDENLYEAIMIELDKDALFYRVKTRFHVELTEINASSMYRFAVALYVQSNATYYANLAFDYLPSPDSRYATQAITEMLRCNTTITHLCLSDSHLFDEGARDLAQVLVNRNILAEFILRGTFIKDEGCRDLVWALTNNSTLTLLDLTENYIGSKGAGYIANMLAINQTLTLLDLSDNEIGAEGTNHIARALTINRFSSLTTLELGSNNIGDEGASHIATMLMTNKKLVTLDLSRNNISDVGLAKIAEAIKVNKTLMYLNLEDNPIEDETMLDAIQVRVAKNLHDHNTQMKTSTLFSLSLASNILNDYTPPITYKEILDRYNNLLAQLTEFKEQYEKCITEIEETYGRALSGHGMRVLQQAMIPPKGYDAIIYENPANAPSSSQPNDTKKKASSISYLAYVTKLSRSIGHVARIFTIKTIEAHKEQLPKIDLLLTQTLGLQKQLQAHADSISNLSDLADLKKDVADLCTTLEGHHQNTSTTITRILDKSTQEALARHLSQMTRNTLKIAEEINSVMIARDGKDAPSISELCALPSVQNAITYGMQWELSIFKPRYENIINRHKKREQEFQDKLQLFSQTPPSAAELSEFTTEHVTLAGQLIAEMIALIEAVDKQHAWQKNPPDKKALKIFNERLVEFLAILQKSQAEILVKTDNVISNPGQSSAAFLSSSSNPPQPANSSGEQEKPSSALRPGAS